MPRGRPRKTETKLPDMEELPDIQIKSQDIRILTVNIEGISDLLSNRINKEEMVERILGTVTDKKPRDLDREFRDKFHIISGNREDIPKKYAKMQFGFPSSGFFQGMKKACADVEGIDGSKFIRNVRLMDDELVPLKYTEIEQRIDQTRNSDPKRSPNVTSRPAFKNWSCTLHIEYNRGTISAETILLLLTRAGRGVGVGSWRPENRGPFGRYKPVSIGSDQK